MTGQEQHDEGGRMCIKPEEALESTNYILIYGLLHNYYISKPDDILLKALTKCKENLTSSYYDYGNFKSVIFLNDIARGLEFMDQVGIAYDKQAAIDSATIYRAGKCLEYLQKISS